MKRDFLLEDRKRLFWTLQLGGWAAWGLFGKYLYTWSWGEDLPPAYALYVALITGIGILLTLGLRYLYHALWLKKLWVRGLGFLGGSAVAGALWFKSREFIYGTWFKPEKEMGEWLKDLGPAAETIESIYFIENYFRSISLMVAWSVIYFSIKYYRLFQEVRASALKSSALACLLYTSDAADDLLQV